MGPLAAHGLRTTSSPLQARGALSRGDGAGGGSRGNTGAAPPNATLLAGWPRGRGGYRGGVRSHDAKGIRSRARTTPWTRETRGGGCRCYCR